MTGLSIRQCPRCELRFTTSSELEHHLANDHRPRQERVEAVPAAATTVTAPAPTSAAGPAASGPAVSAAPLEPAPPPAEQATPARPHLAHLSAESLTRRMVAWMFAVACIALILLAIVFGSVPIAVVAAVAVIALIGYYVWQSRAAGRRVARR